MGLYIMTNFENSIKETRQGKYIMLCFVRVSELSKSLSNQIQFNKKIVERVERLTIQLNSTELTNSLVLSKHN